MSENSPPDTRPFTRRRVSGPVNGLKKMPMATPNEDEEQVPEAVALLVCVLDPVGSVPKLHDRALEAILDVLVLANFVASRNRLGRHEVVVISLAATNAARQLFRNS